MKTGQRKQLAAGLKKAHRHLQAEKQVYVSEAGKRARRPKLRRACDVLEVCGGYAQI